mgnify:CR=1 FL=1
MRDDGGWLGSGDGCLQGALAVRVLTLDKNLLLLGVAGLGGWRLLGDLGGELLLPGLWAHA